MRVVVVFKLCWLMHSFSEIAMKIVYNKRTMSLIIKILMNFKKYRDPIDKQWAVAMAACWFQRFI